MKELLRYFGMHWLDFVLARLLNQTPTFHQPRLSLPSHLYSKGLKWKYMDKRYKQINIKINFLWLTRLVQEYLRIAKVRTCKFLLKSYQSDFFTIYIASWYILCYLTFTEFVLLISLRRFADDKCLAEATLLLYNAVAAISVFLFFYYFFLMTLNLQNPTKPC